MYLDKHGYLYIGTMTWLKGIKFLNQRYDYTVIFINKSQQSISQNTCTSYVYWKMYIIQK